MNIFLYLLFIAFAPQVHSSGSNSVMHNPFKKIYPPYVYGRKDITIKFEGASTINKEGVYYLILNGKIYKAGDTLQQNTKVFSISHGRFVVIRGNNTRQEIVLHTK